MKYLPLMIVLGGVAACAIAAYELLDAIERDGMKGHPVGLDVRGSPSSTRRCLRPPGHRRLDHQNSREMPSLSNEVLVACGPTPTGTFGSAASKRGSNPSSASASGSRRKVFVRNVSQRRSGAHRY